MDGDRNRVGRSARHHAACSRLGYRCCGIRSLHPASDGSCCAGRDHSDQADARNNKHDDRGPRCGADSAGDLQRAECIVTGLLHGYPAIAAGRTISFRKLGGTSLSTCPPDQPFGGGPSCPIGRVTKACRCFSSSRINAAPATRSLKSQRWFFTPSKISA